MSFRIFGVLSLASVLSILCMTLIYYSEPESNCLKSGSNSSYCSITGNIESLYINDSGLVVVKFKTGVLKEDAKKEGFIIKDGTRAVFEMGESVSEFKLDMLRTAYLGNKVVTVHAHEVHKKYLLIDHIWLK